MRPTSIRHSSLALGLFTVNLAINLAACAPGDQIPVGVTAESAALCGVGSAPLARRGGGVVPTPKVVLVWWGAAAGYNGVTRATLPAFFTDVVQSDWFDVLNEYSVWPQWISRGSYVGQYSIPGSSGSSLSEVQYQLQQGLSQGLLPAPDASTVYVVVFPLSFESQLCTDCGGCGQRGSFAYGGNRVRFASVTDRAAGLDAVTVDTSALLAELVVDPDLNGWESTSGNGIDAICGRQSATFQTFDLYRSYKVSKLYSNSAQQCVGAPIKPYCIGSACNNLGVNLRVGSPATVSINTEYELDQIWFSMPNLPSGVTAQFSTNPMGWHGSTNFTLTADPFARGGTSDLSFNAYNTANTHLGQAHAGLTVEAIEVLSPSQSIPMSASAGYFVRNGTLNTRTLAAGAAGDGFSYAFDKSTLAPGEITTLTVTPINVLPSGRSFKVYSTDGYAYTFGGITITCATGLSWCNATQQCLVTGTPCGNSGGGGGSGCTGTKIDCCGDGVCVSPAVCARVGCP